MSVRLNIQYSTQFEVEKLLADGINKIIVLGHSGFEKDKEVAAKIKGVDIIVGGHSSTFLYTCNWRLYFFLLIQCSFLPLY